MAGMALAIIDGQPVSPIATAFGATRGTLFLPRRRHTARKAWLGGRLRMRGTISVDSGAAAALARGSSLLAAGVTAIAGDFVRGDAVAVLGPDGQTLARGLAEYDAAEAARLLGHPSSAHEAILGYAPRSALIHRDQMVLL
jgi:glutamate 5-kinase